jgi:hypothetical protein
MKYLFDMISSIFFFIRNTIITISLIVLIAMMFNGYFNAIGPNSEFGSSNAAAWVQAIGAFTAILVAFWMGERQIKMQRRQEKEKAQIAYARKINIISTILRRTKQSSERLIQVSAGEISPEYWKISSESLSTFKRSLFTDSILEFPDSTLLEYCINIGDQIDYILSSYSFNLYHTIKFRALSEEERNSLETEVNRLLLALESATKHTEHCKTSYYYRAGLVA